jgi:CPA1 family monovalent cation:H+ antiporter
VLRHAPDDLTAILASLVAVFATSLLTEQLHGSAVIAVVVAGVLVGHEMRTHLEPSRVLALQGFWEVAAFVINVWLFLLVGIQLSGDMLVREAWPILLAVIALHAGRAIAVYLCFGALHLSGQGVPWRWQHVMVFGNVKGALSMAAVLALPQDIPYRDRLIAIVFGVTLVTLLTQALPFRRFLTWLGVAGENQSRDVDAARAVLISARRAQLELDQLLASGLIARGEHAERRAAFQRDIIGAEHTLRASGTQSHSDVVLPAVVVAQKAAILDAVRRGLITERTASEHVAELDERLLEATAGEHLAEDEQ